MRVYSCEFENQTITAADTDVDIFEIVPAANKPVRLLALYLANVGADVGDIEEEMLRLQVIRGHTTGGSGGVVTTPRPIGSGIEVVAGFTCDTMNDVIKTGGTVHNLFSDGWNIRVPYQMIWPSMPEDMRPGASAVDTSILLRMLTTVGDTINVSGTLFVGEMGG